MDDPTGIQERLLMCVDRGDIDGVRDLIEAGANINHVWGGGREFVPGATALGVAICSLMSYGTMNTSSVDMVTELFALGADASADVQIIFSAMIFEAIKAVGDGYANLDFLAALIAAGANVQATTYHFSETPLHAVFRIDDPKKAVAVANLLISKGALVDAKNDRGERPLDYALRVKYSDGRRMPATHAASNRALAKCLLRAGAATTGLADDLEESPAKTSVDLVIKAGGWKRYALKHKQVLVGLVTKCKPMPDDAAGLVVDFYCPSGGS